jgi:hypothetical protein
MGFANKLKKKVFGSGPKMAQASTLTPEQAALLQQQAGFAQQYSPGIWNQMNQMALNPENTYNRSQADIEGFYNDTMLNPAMQQFRDVVVPGLRAEYGNKMHSSALKKTLGKTFTDLQNNLSQQRGNLFYNELLQKQQGRENALGRQMTALSGMGGMMNAPLGVDAIRNYQKQGGAGLLTQANQVMGTASAGLNLGKQIAGMVG